MEVIKFEYFNTSDPYDLFYDDGQAWSRICEYKFAEDFLLSDPDIKSKKIHNTCWGFVGVHVRFKERLDAISSGTLSSDLISSSLPNTTTYDILSDNPYMHEKFDYVINISSLEHINHPHQLIIANQLKQVKPGGFLILTFDLPGLMLDAVENFLEKKIDDVGERLNGKNFHVKNQFCEELNCGKLIIRK